MFDGCVLRKLKCRHDFGYLFAAENSHNVVLERNIKLTASRITLSAGPAPELVIDSSGFVPFRADYIKTAEINHFFVIFFPNFEVPPFGYWSSEFIRRRVSP